MLLRKISTLFCIQTFHLLFDCLIHQTAIWLSVQQNTFLTCTSNITALITETTSFDNKTQAKSSKRGILRSFIGATLHFLAHKFTSTPWLQTTLTETTAQYAWAELSQNPWISINLFPQVDADPLSRELGSYKNLSHNSRYSVNNKLSHENLAMQTLWNISFDWTILGSMSPRGSKTFQ